MNIGEIQSQLKKMGLDGWLLYDFQGSNPITRKISGMQGGLVTRRWFYWIPCEGEAEVFCHSIERQSFSRLDVKKRYFASWQELEEGLAAMLAGHRKIAMEYSPFCAIPYVSRVDAGTVELVKKLDKLVVSSADLVQYFEARWTEEQFQMHLEASRSLMAILFATFERIRDSVRAGAPLSEYSAQRFILDRFREGGLTAASLPIVAVNENSGNPHFDVEAEAARPIRSGDFLLIDLWAKLQRPSSVYADYTWVAFLGETVPERFVHIWEVVRSARDAATNLVHENYPKGVELRGWQVDGAARKLIQEAGYGAHFVHRTGHSIGEEDHGNGANMDGLETKDERRLIPHTCFSIEPGIYLPEFGIRSEVNVFLRETDVVVTGDPIQQEIHRIF
ncbi:MAG: M24 family metallopeptidase [Acidobacteriota bacterium]